MQQLTDSGRAVQQATAHPLLQQHTAVQYSTAIGLLTPPLDEQVVPLTSAILCDAENILPNTSSVAANTSYEALLSESLEVLL